MHFRKSGHWNTLMTRLTKYLIHSLLILFFASSSLAAEPNLDDPVQLESFVDGVVKPLMKANNSPAGTVAIARGGELILAKGYGFEDVEQQVPVDPYETLFRPGSTSKLFTWVSVMQLVEQGKLDLDAWSEDLVAILDAENYASVIVVGHSLGAQIALHLAVSHPRRVGALALVDPIVRIHRWRPSDQIFILAIT